MTNPGQGARLLARFSQDRPLAQVLHRSDHQRVRLLGFEPWQTTTTWPSDADAATSWVGLVTDTDTDRRVAPRQAPVPPSTA